MTEKAKLDALVRAMDSFVSGLDPIRYHVNRQQIGEGAIYVFTRDGAELGRIAAIAGPEWSTPAYLEVTATAASRGAEASFQQHGTGKDWPQEERQRAQDFNNLWRQVNAYLDLHFGRGMWAGVWEHVKQGQEAPQSAGDSGESLPPVTDPTDQRILDWVTKDPDLTDQAIGQKLDISRQAANTRRRKLEAMGYKVR